jgi:hypothetical protein
VAKTLEQQTALRGQSKSTMYNYLRRIALISLHFKRLPEKIADDKLNEYLTELAISNNTPSRSRFKHIDKFGKRKARLSSDLQFTPLNDKSGESVPLNPV